MAKGTESQKTMKEPSAGLEATKSLSIHDRSKDQENIPISPGPHPCHYYLTTPRGQTCWRPGLVMYPILLRHTHRPDLLEARACDVPYYKSAQRLDLLEAEPCSCALLLLHNAQRPDSPEAGACDVPYYTSAQRTHLLQAGACDVPYYHFTMPRSQTCWRPGLVMCHITSCPEATLAGGWGLPMYLIITLQCPETRLAGGWGLLMYLIISLQCPDAQTCGSSSSSSRSSSK